MNPRRLLSPVRVLAALAATAVLLFPAASPTQARAADVNVGCSASALLTSVAFANTGVDPVLNLAPYCVYEYTSGDVNGDALPQITLTTGTVIIHGNNATIRRSFSTSNDFRIFDIATGASLTMDSLTIANGDDSTGNGGGGILNKGTLTTTDVNVQGSRASIWLGGGINSSGTLTMNGGIIHKNISGANGGGINSTGNISLTDVTISGNRALDAGGINLNGDSVTESITGGSIDNNTSGYQGGGGMHVAGSADATISDVSITNNHAVEGPGGGILFGGLGSSTLSVTGSSVISGNTSSGNTSSASGAPKGGGIYLILTGRTLNLTGTKITGNKTIGANGQGAGIYASGTSQSVNLTDDAQVTENLASGDFSQGGGIYTDGTTTVSVDSSSVSSNKVTGDQSVTGGIYNNSSTNTVDLNNATVDNNTAPFSPAPGGIYTNTAIVPTGTTTITGNTPTNCLDSPATVTSCIN